ncbi:META domain-containing protein [Erythrobacter sp. NE805]|uniref:META domain-containing protein n=1 Tax=Erythrobacter sp. NE805 TaxID=3389875 RepID=UPI00396B26D1
MKSAILAVAATLMLGGCMTIPEAHPLTGTKWQLATIDTPGSTTTLTPAVQRRHTITLKEGGEAQVQLDCNRGRASWTAGKPRAGAGPISFGPVASTKMLCPQPSFGDQLAKGLGEASRYATTLDGRQLVLEGAELRLTFSPIAE